MRAKKTLIAIVVVVLIICFMPKGTKNAVDYFDPSAHQSEGPVSNKKGLSDTEVQAIAKELNKEINFSGNTSDKYNLGYSGFKIESDNYNRYIVCMHYQYEDAKRNYHSGDAIVYFRYDPETDQYYYKRTNIKFPMKVLSEESLINSIKEDIEFGWGTDPDIPVADNKVSESPEVNTPIANVSSDGGQAYLDVVTSDNFEQVVPLNKRSDWYDNGIFSSYFASCDPQSDETWEYIGTTSDIFRLSYYDYTEVDVFRVDSPDGWKSYLFVPYNENIGNPPVVFLFLGSNEVPLEIWNGSYTANERGNADTDNTQDHETNSLHTHSYGNWTKANNTSHTRTCSCGEKETEAHTFDSGKVTKEPTETATGVKTYTCTKCNATKTETLAKLDHTHGYGNWERDTTSSHSRYCSCGDKISESHTFNSGVVTKEPTSCSTGIITYTCTKCGYFEEEIIPAEYVEPEPDSDPYRPETMDYDQAQVCWKCGHDDGTVMYTAPEGQEVDTSWTCSSCGTYNKCSWIWNYN